MSSNEISEDFLGDLSWATESESEEENKEEPSSDYDTDWAPYVPRPPPLPPVPTRNPKKSSVVKVKQ